eukprot:6172689-Pleurochrysis_carterae.AAC.2
MPASSATKALHCNYHIIIKLWLTHNSVREDTGSRVHVLRNPETTKFTTLVYNAATAYWWRSRVVNA